MIPALNIEHSRADWSRGSYDYASSAHDLRVIVLGLGTAKYGKARESPISTKNYQTLTSLLFQPPFSRPPARPYDPERPAHHPPLDNFQCDQQQPWRWMDDRWIPCLPLRLRVARNERVGRRSADSHTTTKVRTEEAGIGGV